MIETARPTIESINHQSVRLIMILETKTAAVDAQSENESAEAAATTEESILFEIFL